MYDGRPEEQLYADEGVALQVANLRAAEQNAKEQAQPNFIAAKNIGKLKIDEAKYDQFANGLWNAWHAYRSIVETIETFVAETNGAFSKDDAQAFLDSLKWEVEYREEKDRPLDVLVDAVADALEGDASGLQGAYDALPAALRRRPDADDCCPGCGACPGFTGADCDETCEWATTGGGRAS